MIYNLMSNAIKFTRPGGKVGLISEKVLLNEKEYLQIKVKDTGIGIPGSGPSPLIFDRFYQVEGQMTTGRRKVVKQNRTFAGTGIGLALTKRTD
ncbi:MAG: ATP-binding protein [Saprospiraceae bacterium]